MMHLVPLFQSTQDRDRVFDRRLADINLLETTFQSLIFFDVFLIFGKRRRADARKVPRERWLEHADASIAPSDAPA